MLLNKKDIINIFEKLKEYYKDIKDTELDYINPYTLLVAIMLSAQATDKGVNKATKELFKIVKTPEEMINLGEEKLKTYIKSINYYNTKAKNIILMSEKLIKNYNSTVPNNREDLMSLNGVGRKTANLILEILYGLDTIAVDTHVFRVSNRLGIVKADNVLDTEKQLDKKVPQEYKKYINKFLVIFGRYICKAKSPNCENCPISKICKKNNI